MKIVIPDDYQDIVDQLECFSLIRHHEVIRYREPASDLAQLVERLRLPVFLAILAVQALRKRTCDSPWTILGFVIAIAIGYAMKFGFVTKDLN